ncbi:MAG: hypothetical protein JWO03_1709 [Bacteroidetes bacterium]|nr:hypothetical protein [Bacteroidota bacterium]
MTRPFTIKTIGMENNETTPTETSSPSSGIESTQPAVESINDSTQPGTTEGSEGDSKNTTINGEVKELHNNDNATYYNNKYEILKNVREIQFDPTTISENDIKNTAKLLSSEERSKNCELLISKRVLLLDFPDEELALYMSINIAEFAQKNGYKLWKTLLTPGMMNLEGVYFDNFFSSIHRSDNPEHHKSLFIIDCNNANFTSSLHTTKNKRDEYISLLSESKYDQLVILIIYKHLYSIPQQVYTLFAPADLPHDPLSFLAYMGMRFTDDEVSSLRSLINSIIAKGIWGESPDGHYTLIKEKFDKYKNFIRIDQHLREVLGKEQNEYQEKYKSQHKLEQSLLFSALHFGEVSYSSFYFIVEVLLEGEKQPSVRKKQIISEETMQHTIIDELIEVDAKAEWLKMGDDYLAKLNIVPSINANGLRIIRFSDAEFEVQSRAYFNRMFAASTSFFKKLEDRGILFSDELTIEEIEKYIDLCFSWFTRETPAFRINFLKNLLTGSMAIVEDWFTVDDIRLNRISVFLKRWYKTEGYGNGAHTVLASFIKDGHYRAITNLIFKIKKIMIEDEVFNLADRVAFLLDYHFGAEEDLTALLKNAGSLYWGLLSFCNYYPLLILPTLIELGAWRDEEKHSDIVQLYASTLIHSLTVICRNKPDMISKTKQAAIPSFFHELNNKVNEQEYAALLVDNLLTCTGHVEKIPKTLMEVYLILISMTLKEFEFKAGKATVEDMTFALVAATLGEWYCQLKEADNKSARSFADLLVRTFVRTAEKKTVAAVRRLLSEQKMYLTTLIGKIGDPKAKEKKRLREKITALYDLINNLNKI